MVKRSADGVDGLPGGAALAWTVSPWRANWRRPAAALAICIVVAALAGISFTYPNYPVGYDINPGALTEAPEPNGVPGASAAEQEHRSTWGWQALSWSLGGLLLMLGMTASLYLPVRYKLDQEGVTTYFLNVPTSRPWRHYRNFYAHDNGVHLTTMHTPSRLDAFRGHFLQFAGNREEVLAYITQHMTLRGVPEGREPPGA